MKHPVYKTVVLDAIVGGGQAIGTLEDGKKALVWGGLPSEKVQIQVTKNKSRFVDGVVTDILEPSPSRIAPRDPDSYLSTSPWQMMNFEAEQHYKAALIEEAFELHDVVLPETIEVFTDSRQYEYRNKIEFSFWFNTEANRLSLAFFRRGTHGKIPVDHTSLAHPSITHASNLLVTALNNLNVEGRALKTLLIRCNQKGEIAWQLYVKNENFSGAELIKKVDIPACIRGEVIYSDPKSPASVATKRLASTSQAPLTDTVLGTPFSYAAEGFFQVNIPVYEQALRDMKQWVEPNTPLVDLYSGVGTIGLTIGEANVTLVEVNEQAVNEMRRNIEVLDKKGRAHAVLAASEHALNYITKSACIVVDPPRAGLHDDVIKKLLNEKPKRIVYLSCNPVAQARDVQLLAEAYGIRAHRGYNFFPRTPHIEHLVILDERARLI